MNISLLFYTARYLKPVQIYSRLLTKLKGRSIRFKGKLDLREKTQWIPAIFKNPSLMISPQSFCFLNETHDIITSDDWNNQQYSPLWIYNLHYFDYIFTEETSGRNEWHNNIIEKWILENPPGCGAGWDPYPSSLRIVNWMKRYLYGNMLSVKALNSLKLQASFVFNHLEYHLLANHLFANAKALVFAGLFFEGSVASKWLQKGLKILEKEIPEQILGDGGNFERSPMYHAIMTEDILDLINISKSFPSCISSVTVDVWKNKAQKMLLWLKGMCHDDGKISLFNDAAFCIAPEYEQLEKYAERLGIFINKENFSKVTDFKGTGYIRIQNELYLLLIDAGNVGPDYQPGHAHADTFSFELSKGNQRIIVDSGVSCYGKSQERLHQRGTAAHNTVSIDNENSSEVWSGFRVARRARIIHREIENNGEDILISAAHDGYRRIKGVGFHYRKWKIQSNRILITDTIEGTGKHEISAFLHFHPDLNVSMENENSIEIKNNDSKIVIKIDPDVRVGIEESTYHPEFGLSINSKKLLCFKDVFLPFTFSTEIIF
jgi:uncharacterized heparinase superfamily protein